MTKTNFTIRHKKELIAAHGNNCIKCGESDPNKIQWHHVIPRSLGGEDSIENIIPLCINCHYAEHGMKTTMETNSQSGRPRSGLTYEQYVRYVFGEATREEVLTEAGASCKSDVKALGRASGYDRQLFREYGIYDFRVASHGWVTLRFHGGRVVNINTRCQRSELNEILQKMKTKGNANEEKE